MTPDQWVAFTGIAGTFLLAIIPIRVEWFRYRTKGVGTTPVEDPLLAELFKINKEIKEAVIIAKWSIRDSLCIILGIGLLMASYIIPLCS